MLEGLTFKTIDSICFSSVPLRNLEIWPSVLQHRKFCIKIICTIKCAAGIKTCGTWEKKKKTGPKSSASDLKFRFAAFCSIRSQYSAVVLYCRLQAHIAREFRLFAESLCLVNFWRCSDSLSKGQQQKLCEYVQCCRGKPPLWAEHGLSKPTSLKTSDVAVRLMPLTLFCFCKGTKKDEG